MHRRISIQCSQVECSCVWICMIKSASEAPLVYDIPFDLSSDENFLHVSGHIFIISPIQLHRCHSQISVGTPLCNLLYVLMVFKKSFSKRLGLFLSCISVTDLQPSQNALYSWVMWFSSVYLLFFFIVVNLSSMISQCAFLFEFHFMYVARWFCSC